MRWLLILSLLLAFPAFAQDQSLAPDGEDDPTDVFSDAGGGACVDSTACSATTCETDVNEGADGGGDDLDIISDTGSTSATILFDFPTPSANPSTVSSDQTIDLIMTCADDDTTCTEDCTGSPQFDAEIYCNGAALTTPQVIFTNEGISAPDQDKSTTFTFDTTDCATDGSDLQLFITLGRSGGAPGSRRWAGIEAVEWEVTHAAAGARRVIIVD